MEDCELARSYADLMAAHTRFAAPEVVAAHAWPERGHVVDVGGGSGSLLTWVLDAPRQLDDLVSRAGLGVTGRRVTGTGIHLVSCAPAG